jgi:hypothetical protein
VPTFARVLCRIATSQPLVADAAFKKWWDDVFDSRHALVPDIKNSEEWTTKLILCQKVVTKATGGSGDQVTRPVKTLSFAKQRFDSTATPQRQFCCLIVPIALLLAYVASDARQKGDVRSRARRRLFELPSHVITAGLSAAYSEASVQFIRHFDVAEHDPAETYSERVAFVKKMNVLFMDGRIWEPSGDVVGTSLEVVLKEAMSAEPVFVGDEILRLYKQPTPAEAKELSDAIRSVTETMVARVMVELSLEDIAVLFTAFSLRRWHGAIAEARQGRTADLDRLREHTRLMFTAWRIPVDWRSGVRALESSAHHLCGLYSTELRSGSAIDNRTAWARVVAGDWELYNDVPLLNRIIRIYLVTMDSTCGIERDFSCLVNILEKHRGPLADTGSTVSHLVDVTLDGPVIESDIGTHRFGDTSPLEPTSLCNDFAKKWIDLHGRRFKVYQPGTKPGPKRKWGSTQVKIAKGTARSMHILANKGLRGAGESEDTVIGLRRSAFWGSGDRVKSVATKRFEKLTQKKHKLHLALWSSRNLGRGNPYAHGEFDPRNTLRKGNAVTGPEKLVFRRLPRGAQIKVLDCCDSDLPPAAGYSITRWDRTTPRAMVRDMLSTQLVVCDSLWAIDEARGCKVRDMRLALFLCVYALGKPLAPRCKWCHFLCGEPADYDVIFFKPVAKCTELSLFVSDRLRRFLPVFCQVLDLLVRVQSVHWTKVDRRQGQCRTLESPTDATAFLVDVRRVDHACRGVLGGKYFAAPP